MQPIPIYYNKHTQQGFTLLEVLVAMIIFAIGIIGVASMQINATRANAFAYLLSEAYTYAQDMQEQLMNTVYSHGSLAVGSHTDSNPPEGFYRSWTVTSDPSGNNRYKIIEVTVGWDQRITSPFNEIYLTCYKSNPL
ncbi:MAG: type IV pilus modification protein PilV [Desulfobacterales bacterium]|nr:type IV pilus modification protein PilV [Desulfobacterales bacterium]